MASFWKKISKTFLTLLLMLGVFFAGCVGLAPTKTANAVFTDTKISNEVMYSNTVMFVSYAEDILVGVDENGYVYRATDGTANLVKTGVQLGKISPYKGWTYNDASMYPTGKYIAYKNGTLVVSSYDGSNTNMYYSTDYGQTWKSNNLGSVGKPVTLISGGNLFVCQTDASGVTKFLTSTDGIIWQATPFNADTVTVDTTLKYNNGYFIKIDAYSEDIANNVYVSLSLDCKTWVKILAPKQSYVNNSQIFNVSTVAFSIDNALYCLQDGCLYKTTTFDTNATWQLVNDDFGWYLSIEPYLNGIIATEVNDNMYNVSYLEIFNNNKINAKTLISNMASSFMHEDFPRGADTIAIGKNYLCVGFSGQYFYSERVQYKTAMFSTYKQAVKYNVTFVDWNGNAISQVQVNENGTVLAPAEPTRTGYTFAGWDYDLTQPITQDTTIVATYTRNTLNVLFKDYNGQTISSTSVLYGDKITPEDIPIPAERVGYQFKGWDKDTTQTVTSDITFIAQYSQEATLTINYPKVVGNTGLDNQFYKTENATKKFIYIIGDVIKNQEYNTWYNENILPWLNDFTSDSDYDYDTRFIAWNEELPTTIEHDLTITAETEKLVNVRLDYYSQLRFNAKEIEGVSFYFTFVGAMKVERLLPVGTIIDLEVFKDAEVDYDIYNANRNVFYNNLEHFEFIGWDKDITVPVTEDVIINGLYKMPTINVKMFDLDGYLFNEVNQPISFMTIEDLQAMQGHKESWDKFCEGIRLFFTLQWGELGDTIADQLDFAEYISNIREYHNKSRQILTAYVVVNTDNEEMYGGVFKYGAVNVTSPALKYYSGTARENNMSYWINPIVFSTNAYSLTCTVDYDTALGSAIKLTSKITGVLESVFNWLWEFIKEYWWAIVLVVLAIIFRKPLIAALTMLFSAIKKGTQKLSAKIKSKSKNSKYKKTEKEYTAVKKESKKKEK